MGPPDASALPHALVRERGEQLLRLDIFPGGARLLRQREYLIDPRACLRCVASGERLREVEPPADVLGLQLECPQQELLAECRVAAERARDSAEESAACDENLGIVRSECARSIDLAVHAM